MRYLCLLLLSSLVLSACTTVRHQHGYMLEVGEDELTAVPGIDSKDTVMARYGEPSIRPALNDNSWYYISANASARAFYHTKTTQQDIVAFNFTADGKLLSVEKFDLSDSVPVRHVERITPTRGKKLTFWEQLLGSVGSLPIPSEPQGPGQP